jgi:hypothetical protein
MHKRESGDSDAHHALTQDEADNCCAGSEHNNPSSLALAPARTISVVLSGPAVAVSISAPVLVPHLTWPAVETIIGKPARKHLLLSVFLV